MINPQSLIPNPSLSRYWLLIGVAALAVAGLFALVLVVARAPDLDEVQLSTTLFRKALVVHVDLSVLVWFLSIACLLWSVHAAPSHAPLPYLEEAALLAFAGGALLIAASPLDPHGEALMSNYIPVIASPVFFLGLGLLFCGVALMLARLFSAPSLISGPSAFFDKPLRFGVLSAGAIALIALGAFIWSHRLLPRQPDATQYYDLLFWGGGHVLQFVHAQILLVCWIVLARALKPEFRLPRKWLKVLLCIGPATALVLPLGYMLYDIASFEYRDFFTRAMLWTNGLAPEVLAAFVLVTLWQTRAARKGAAKALWSSLLWSALLFLYGGLLGEMIRGQNVVIPAHYHGSIVGITLAFMGVAYLLLPRLGYRDPAGWRLAYWQPTVYGIGQALHVSGLAWSGGYGVLRKTPGGLEHVALSVKIAMGIMGLGGTLAIVGGFLFVIVVGRAVFASSKA